MDILDQKINEAEAIIDKAHQSVNDFIFNTVIPSFIEGIQDWMSDIGAKRLILDVFGGGTSDWLDMWTDLDSEPYFKEFDLIDLENYTFELGLNLDSEYVEQVCEEELQLTPCESLVNLYNTIVNEAGVGGRFYYLDDFELIINENSFEIVRD